MREDILAPYAVEPCPWQPGKPGYKTALKIQHLGFVIKFQESSIGYREWEF